MYPLSTQLFESNYEYASVAPKVGGVICLDCSPNVGRPYNQYLSFVATETTKVIQLPRDFDACFLACWLAKTFLFTGVPLVQFAGACVSDAHSRTRIAVVSPH